MFFLGFISGVIFVLSGAFLVAVVSMIYAGGHK